MSVRRKTANRLTLYRKCGTCGREFSTTAETPWVRQVPREGKRQATTYFCSQSCFRSSYKHKGWWDGKAEERRRAKDAARDQREKNRRYYAAHAEELRKRQRERYWANPELSREIVRYNHQKRRLVKS